MADEAPEPASGLKHREIGEIWLGDMQSRWPWWLQVSRQMRGSFETRHDALRFRKRWCKE